MAATQKQQQLWSFAYQLYQVDNPMPQISDYKMRETHWQKFLATVPAKQRHLVPQFQDAPVLFQDEHGIRTNIGWMPWSMRASYQRLRGKL